MKAFLLTESGFEQAEVPDPVAGPGQVVVKVTAAGLCHSDTAVAARDPRQHSFSLPIVLGHELAGEVVECGREVRGFEPGDAVVGFGPRGCRRCEPCAAGFESYCRRQPEGVFPPGLGAPGALADYVAVEADYLLDSGGVAPDQAAALSDAGLTSLGALNRAIAMGPKPCRSIVVIGIGGLGHVALQLARLRGFERVIAVDQDESKLRLARGLDADLAALAHPLIVDEVRAFAGGGVDVVIDLVASDETLRTGAALLAVDGVLSIVGVGHGRLPVGMLAVPLGTTIDLPFWGSRGELAKLLELATERQVTVATEAITMAEVAATYARLNRGEVLGRAVMCP